MFMCCCVLGSVFRPVWRSGKGDALASGTSGLSSCVVWRFGTVVGVVCGVAVVVFFVLLCVMVFGIIFGVMFWVCAVVCFCGLFCGMVFSYTCGRVLWSGLWGMCVFCVVGGFSA